MADIDSLITGLVAYLKADSAVDALIDSRIYPQVLPEARVVPAVTYQVVANPPSHFSGATYRKPYLLLKCWSYTHALSWQVAKALRDALQFYHGNLGTVHAYCLLDDMRDGSFEPLPAPGLYPVLVYVKVDFKE